MHQVGQWKWAPGLGSQVGKCEAGLFSAFAGGLLASKWALK